MSTVIPIAPLPFTGVALYHLRCYPDAHKGRSTSTRMSQYFWCVWVCIVPGVVDPSKWIAALCLSDVPLPLTEASLHYPRCFNASHSGSFMSFLGSHCCWLGWHHIYQGVPLLLIRVASCHLRWWVCVILDVSLPLTVVTPCHSSCFTKIHWIELCHFEPFIAAHWCGSMLSQIFHCHFLGWLCLISFVFLLLLDVFLCHSRCFTAAHWSDSSLS